MNEYWKFDIEKFLKDSKDWKRDIIRLERDRDKLLGLSAISQDTPVQTSNISDTTGNTAARRDAYTEKIDALKHKITILENAIGTLTPKQKDCIDLFFFSKRMIGYGIDVFCEKWDCQRTDTYETRRKALAILSDYISVRL